MMRCTLLLLLAASGCGLRFGSDAGPTGGADAGPGTTSSDAATPASNARSPVDGSVPLVDGGLPPTCWSGTAVPCECPGGPGFLYCEMARWGGCECPGVVDADDGGAPTTYDGGMPGCTGDPEWCDGRDNDCDGVVDEGEPCPDPTVRNALPYAGTVYLQVGEEDGSVSLHALSPSGSRIAGLPEHGAVRFRPTDGALAYQRFGQPIFEHVPGGAPRELSTPPCFGRTNQWDFDGLGRLHYVCDDSIRRTEGLAEPLGVLPPDHEMVRVLANGRKIVHQRHGVALTFELRDVDGLLLSTTPTDRLVGDLTIVSSATTVLGDDAFVAFNRVYRGGSRREVVVFRVNATTTVWSLVRRIPVRAAISGSAIALPDGRFFWTAPEATGINNRQVFEAPVGAPVRVVWRDSDYDDRDGLVSRSLVAQ